ncbi:hypothetical protein [Bifidobacterium biavatii]|uniref:Phage protein n=1 Tax=Bifidobacterium biavatii DSM 23969 TaxID=1437608 RepID=A0A086ZYW8_9BIFI|nr:hypothetical protein [Bifidobacterium biavatii]KFI51718.1 phage protein [Bifidobacterium biavatii DSM 23969]
MYGQNTYQQPYQPANYPQGYNQYPAQQNGPQQAGYAPQPGMVPQHPMPAQSVALPSLDQMMSGGIPSAFGKNDPIGISVTGEILDIHADQQRDFDSKAPLFWDDGNPRMMIVITLQTALHDPMIQFDDGKRRIYVKQGHQSTALAQAARMAGVGNYPRVGDTLTATFSGTTPAKKRGYNDAKNYTYQVKPTDPNKAGLDAVMGQADPYQSAPQQSAPAQQLQGSFAQPAMPQQPLPQVDAQQILQLRAVGKSLPEIQTLTGAPVAEINRILDQASQQQQPGTTTGSTEEPEF